MEKNEREALDEILLEVTDNTHGHEMSKSLKGRKMRLKLKQIMERGDLKGPLASEVVKSYVEMDPDPDSVWLFLYSIGATETPEPDLNIISALNTLPGF